MFCQNKYIQSTCSACIAILLLISSISCAFGHQQEGEAVILMHGLGRTSWSMNLLAKKLEATGYYVVNLGYPSRSARIEELADTFLAPEVERLSDKYRTIHFVTHSMGGIIVRQFLQNSGSKCMGRVVMLAPPNRGSEVIDALGGYRIFEAIMGPASLQLSTSENSLPNRIGPIDCEVGVIAGNISHNPLSSFFFRGENDGKVTVDSTILDGAKDHLTVQASHTIIMNHFESINQIRYFLAKGAFLRESE